MYWTTAVDVARTLDITYQEWCDLYYFKSNPTEMQIHLCKETAYVVLYRNNIIAKEVRFIDDPRFDR